MADLAISAVGLSKRYRIPALHDTEVGVESASGSAITSRLAGRRSTWIDAVADLTFDVHAGEAVGLIGQNGAGKSTLLKLLSRVTRPTAGYADVYGRVGALLEVGTGFHPELTGRENTFLSGAILGMSRREIAERFDQIVDFAEIAPFIDMPVKHYSSGMYARLGFAVAAFLKPSILIVDEILAVGDLAFQAKCFAHMRNLSRDGTTVLFVSHNLLAMADFCQRALVLAEGRLEFDGAVTEAIAAYRRALANAHATASTPEESPPHILRINGIVAGQACECQPNAALHIELEVRSPSDSRLADMELNLVIELPDGRWAIHLRNDIDGTALRLWPGGTILTIDIEDLALVPGDYILWLRMVSLDSAAPAIWDTQRVRLIVLGDQLLTSIAQPRYRFGQRAVETER